MKNIVCLLIITTFITKTFAQSDLSKIFNSIPTPTETGYLVMDIVKKYDASVLNPAGKTAIYTSEYKKALNLGIYSTDLGYATIFSQPITSLGPYLADVKSLANDLGIGSHLDIGSITKTALSGDIQKLMIQTSLIYDNMSSDLEEKGKSDLAALVLIGGWLEGLYIACVAVEIVPDEILKSRIAEQIIVSTLLKDEIEKPEYANNKNLQDVKASLDQVHKGLSQLAKVEKVDGGGVSISEMTITEDGLKNVISFVRITRKEILN